MHQIYAACAQSFLICSKACRLLRECWTERRLSASMLQEIRPSASLLAKEQKRKVKYLSTEGYASTEDVNNNYQDEETG